MLQKLCKIYTKYQFSELDVVSFSDTFLFKNWFFYEWMTQKIRIVISSIESSNHYPLLSSFNALRSVDDSKTECW